MPYFLLSNQLNYKAMKLQKELNVVTDALQQLSKHMDLQKYIETLKQEGGYNDLKTRAVWDFFYVIRYSKLSILQKDYAIYLYDTYGANDKHIDTLLKKAINTFNLKF
jgi:hypothetical protein